MLLVLIHRHFVVIEEDVSVLYAVYTNGVHHHIRKQAYALVTYGLKLDILIYDG